MLRKDMVFEFFISFWNAKPIFSDFRFFTLVLNISSWNLHNICEVEEITILRMFFATSVFPQLLRRFASSSAAAAAHSPSQVTVATAQFLPAL